MPVNWKPPTESDKNIRDKEYPQCYGCKRSNRNFRCAWGTVKLCVNGSEYLNVPGLSYSHKSS